MRFEDLLNELGIDFRRSGHEHCRPGWVQLDCPFCSKGWQHYRLGYNLAKRFCHCWCCGFHPTAQVLAEHTGQDVSRFYRALGEVDTIRFTEERTQGKLELPRGVCSLKEPHKEYLRSRSYDPDDLAKRWNIQGTDFDSPLPWRIFIPIVYRGEVVSWSTRRLHDDDKQRYQAAELRQEKVHRSELLYGEDYCTKHTIIVVEGFFDVWRIGEGAVATMTTSYTRAQLRRMSKYPRRVVCFDSEKAAQARASKLLDDLQAFPGETYGVKLWAKDPSAADPKEITELRERFLR